MSWIEVMVERLRWWLGCFSISCPAVMPSFAVPAVGSSLRQQPKRPQHSQNIGCVHDLRSTRSGKAGERVSSLAPALSGCCCSPRVRSNTLDTQLMLSATVLGNAATGISLQLEERPHTFGFAMSGGVRRALVVYTPSKCWPQNRTYSKHLPP